LPVHTGCCGWILGYSSLTLLNLRQPAEFSAVWAYNPLYGSEAEKWKHNPILHPIRYLRDRITSRKSITPGGNILFP
jgi:hypothetical protein